MSYSSLTFFFFFFFFSLPLLFHFLPLFLFHFNLLHHHLLLPPPPLLLLLPLLPVTLQTSPLPSLHPPPISPSIFPLHSSVSIALLEYLYHYIILSPSLPSFSSSIYPISPSTLFSSAHLFHRECFPSHSLSGMNAFLPLLITFSMRECVIEGIRHSIPEYRILFYPSFPILLSLSSLLLFFHILLPPSYTNPLSISSPFLFLPLSLSSLLSPFLIHPLIIPSPYILLLFLLSLHSFSPSSSNLFPSSSTSHYSLLLLPPSTSFL